MDPNNKNPRVFKLEGYFGINPTTPANNYVYLRQSGMDLTVENFCRAFDITLPPGTPEKLKKSGFYGEQVFSYTANPDGKTVYGIECEVWNRLSR